MATQLTVEIGPDADGMEGWHRVVITIPGLGVIEAGRLDDGSILEAPDFRWVDGAQETIAGLIRDA